MTNISFYLLQGQQGQTRSVEQIVCQLVNKAFQQNNFVYIHTNLPEQANQIDQLLWKLQTDSFIPHVNLSSQALENKNQELSFNKASSTIVLSPSQQKQKSTDFDYPVIINSEQNVIPDFNKAKKEELLINLDSDVPLFFSRFHRLAEIVANSEDVKDKARQRYKFYKERGYSLITHEIS